MPYSLTPHNQVLRLQELCSCCCMGGLGVSATAAGQGTKAAALLHVEPDQAGGRGGCCTALLLNGRNSGG